MAELKIVGEPTFTLALSRAEALTLLKLYSALYDGTKDGEVDEILGQLWDFEGVIVPEDEEGWREVGEFVIAPDKTILAPGTELTAAQRLCALTDDERLALKFAADAIDIPELKELLDAAKNLWAWCAVKSPSVVDGKLTLA